MTIIRFIYDKHQVYQTLEKPGKFKDNLKGISGKPHKVNDTVLLRNNQQNDSLHQ